MIEYVQIKSEEKKKGEKQLLLSKIEFLKIMKSYRKFKELRKLELMLKTALKRKINEVNEEIKIIERTLPRVKEYRTESEKIKMIASVKTKKDLESEIEEIRRKISLLDNS